MSTPLNGGKGAKRLPKTWQAEDVGGKWHASVVQPSGYGAARRKADRKSNGPVIDPDEKNAFQWMREWLKQYGLGSLSGVLKDIITEGVTDFNEVQLRLSDTDAWKQRFAGNEKLRAAGLPTLSVDQYLATESSYAQVMRQYGLPDGFYDDPSDFADFIGNSVSPGEVQQRAQNYALLANNEDDNLVKQLQSMGMSKGDLMAYMMDPDRAMPLLQKKLNTAQLGEASRNAGVVADNDYLAHLSDLGINQQQASAGYGQIGQELDNAHLIATLSDEDLTQRDLEKSVFENDAASTKKVKRLASQERARWGGSGGVASGARSTGGAF